MAANDRNGTGPLGFLCFRHSPSQRTANRPFAAHVIPTANLDDRTPAPTTASIVRHQVRAATDRDAASSTRSDLWNPVEWLRAQISSLSSSKVAVSADFRRGSEQPSRRNPTPLEPPDRVTKDSPSSSGSVQQQQLELLL